MAIFIVGWLAYVGQHQHGVVDGWVVDGSGQPVAGATILLFERGFVTQDRKSVV